MTRIPSQDRRLQLLPHHHPQTDGNSIIETTVLSTWRQCRWEFRHWQIPRGPSSAIRTENIEVTKLLPKLARILVLGCSPPANTQLADSESEDLVNIKSSALGSLSVFTIIVLQVSVQYSFSVTYTVLFCERGGYSRIFVRAAFRIFGRCVSIHVCVLFDGRFRVRERILGPAKKTSERVFAAKVIITPISGGGL